MLFSKKKPAPIRDLRDFLQILSKNKELCVIKEEVDPHLEIAEIHRRVVEKGGPCLLFERVKGSPFSCVTNLFGSEKRLELAFPDRPERMVKELIELATGHFPPDLSTLWNKRSHLKRLLPFRLGTKRQRSAPLLECQMDDLEKLPVLTCWPEDGGPFITLPLVYTEPVGRGAPNLGMYRIQRFGKKEAGLHFQIGKGGGFHYHEAEQQNKNLPVTIFLGGPPALMLSAIAPLPENIPELVFASLLMGEKLDVTEPMPHPLVARAEFALQGYAKPFERRLEGPFGDHYGYYGLAHDYPLFHCDTIYHRKDAIYPATVVGRPIQEDLYIGNYLQSLFAPLIPVVMPQVKELWSYGEAGFHSLAAAIIKERYEKEALTACFRILGEGQLSLTKVLFLTDQPVELKNIKNVLETILCRLKPEEDIRLFKNTSYDTLDYTSPKLNLGSKACFFGLGKEKRALKSEFRGKIPDQIHVVKAFCKGTLLLQGPSYTNQAQIFTLLEQMDLEGFPLVIFVDDVESVAQSELEFLWQTFTRFEPARDMCIKNSTVMIDARMKPWYPKVAVADPETIAKVDERWHDLFE